jgi:hypothetical protein
MSEGLGRGSPLEGGKENWVDLKRKLVSATIRLSVDAFYSPEKVDASLIVLGEAYKPVAKYLETCTPDERISKLAEIDIVFKTTIQDKKLLDIIYLHIKIPPK